jgi:hypothetical protein
VLREGHGRPYRPPSGVYLTLYHLERYRLAREQAATRLKNQIIGHVDRLYPGLVVRDRDAAQRLKPMFRDMWTAKTPRRLLELCPDPYQLRQQTANSLYQQFRAAGIAAVSRFPPLQPEVAAITHFLPARPASSQPALVEIRYCAPPDLTVMIPMNGQRPWHPEWWRSCTSGVRPGRW